MERRGYVYILSTAYEAEGGKPIIKIGRTSRSPNARVRELSRGGPVGMVLAGAVPCRDMVELEKRQFQHARFRSDGGKEYFVADAEEVLVWLREASPRFELELARKGAWAEYVQTKTFKTQSRLNMCFIVPFVCSPMAGLLIKPFHFWSVGVGPALAMGAAWLVGPHFRRLRFVKKLNAEQEAAKREIETKYHLPEGTLGPPRWN